MENINMIKKLDLKDTETAERVMELQIASYKIEAKIIGFYDIPPLKDTIGSLKVCDEIPLVCGGRLVFHQPK
jgi:hypothetical protein